MLGCAAAVVVLAGYGGGYAWARSAGVVDDLSQNGCPLGDSAGHPIINAAFVPAYAVEIRWRALRMRGAWRRFAASGMGDQRTPYDGSLLPCYWYCRGYVDSCCADGGGWAGPMLIDPCGTYVIGADAGRGALQRYVTAYVERRGGSPPNGLYTADWENLTVVADAGTHALVASALDDLRVRLKP